MSFFCFSIFMINNDVYSVMIILWLVCVTMSLVPSLHDNLHFHIVRFQRPLPKDVTATQPAMKSSWFCYPRQFALSLCWIILWSTAIHIVSRDQAIMGFIKPRLHDTTCCQTALTTGWMFVYTIQPVVKRAVKPVPVWQPVVSCIQPVGCIV